MKTEIEMGIAKLGASVDKLNTKMDMLLPQCAVGPWHWAGTQYVQYHEMPHPSMVQWRLDRRRCAYCGGDPHD